MSLKNSKVDLDQLIMQLKLMPMELMEKIINNLDNDDIRFIAKKDKELGDIVLPFLEYKQYSYVTENNVNDYTSELFLGGHLPENTYIHIINDIFKKYKLDNYAILDALFSAIFYGHENSVKAIIDNLHWHNNDYDLNCVSPHSNETILDIAENYYNESLIQYLKSKGVLTSNDISLLHDPFNFISNSIESNTEDETLNLFPRLIELKGQIDLDSEQLNTLLFYYASENKQIVCKHLIKIGANPNQPITMYNKTAIKLAQEEGATEQTIDLLKTYEYV